MNRYKGIDPSTAFQGSPRDPIPIEGLFDGGIVLDRSPQDLELDQSPALDRIRFSRGGIRAGLNAVSIGEAPTSPILALGEHRFVVLGDEVFGVFFRAFRNAGGHLRIEGRSGDGWVVSIDSEIPINQVPLSWRSFFDSLYLADGDRVLRWDRSMALNSFQNDFPAETLTEAEQTSLVTVTPALAYDRRYEVTFSAKVIGPTDPGGKLVIALEHGGVEVDETEIFVPFTSDSTREESWDLERVIFRTIQNNDTVALKLKSVHLPTVDYSANMVVAGDLPHRRFYKQTSRTAINDEYVFDFTITKHAAADSATVSFYANIGGTWTLIDEHVYFDEGTYQRVLTIPGIGDDAGELLGMHITADPSAHITSGQVSWSHDSDVEVEGGYIKYNQAGSISNDLSVVEVEPAVPLQARYLGTFANRILALQFEKDVEKLAWSADGDPTTWIGDGTGEQVVKSRSAPVDPLVVFEAINSNVGVLLREYSIMRVVPTGQLDPALAIVPWVENLGTHSPRSIARAPNSIIFLGHDRMVYILTESGTPTPIGREIQGELKRQVTDLETVEGVFDPIDQLYTITAGSMTWTLDVGELLVRQRVRWLRESRIVRLPSIVQEDVVFVGGDGVVRSMDRGSIVEGGYWTSPTLNKENRQAEYSLTRVVLRYEASEATAVVVEGSGNGGRSWKPGFKTEVELSQTNGEVRRAIQGFILTGYDLRFLVRLPNNAKVLLRGWRAEVIERGQLRSE